MRALYINNHVKNISDIQIDCKSYDTPVIKQDECLIKVIAAGVNPSDALAVMGYFSYARAPRIPGRDFSGIVVQGPAEIIGKKVWGTGGAAGIAFDGTHAEYIALPINAIAEVPNNLDLITAGAQTLPYVTAYYSIVTRAKMQAGETILVVGALGQVGKAAMAICHWQKTKAIALVRGKKNLAQAKLLGWSVIDAETGNLKEQILAANDGKPVNVILNSVGNVYWNDYLACLAEFGRVVTIGAREGARDVTVNLFTQYRANQDLIGVNSVALDYVANAKLLAELKPGFEANQLKPLALTELVYAPEQASLAYQAVMNGTEGRRVVIQFSKELN